MKGTHDEKIHESNSRFECLGYLLVISSGFSIQDQVEVGHSDS
jgi:hypothetical protein